MLPKCEGVYLKFSFEGVLRVPPRWGSGVGVVMEMITIFYFSNKCLQPHVKVYACIEQRVWEISLENLL